MSPASQGALEVERYIGSCLISSSGRPGLQKPLSGCRKQEQQTTLRTSKSQCQNSQFGPVGTWAGGAPLISMASANRRNNQRTSPNQPINEQQLPAHLQNRVPLSRLAVHTQGAPLILSGRFQNNRAKIHNGQSANAIANCVAGLLNNNNNVSAGSNNISTNSNLGKCQPRSNKSMATDQKKPQQQQQQQGTNGNKSGDTANAAGTNKDGSTIGANIDSLSIASDESSGSNNSENSLPRIIKPRKRRKKDRKPPAVVNSSSTNNPATNADVKAADDLQSATVNSSIPTGLTEQQQQQQQQSQQIKSYSYDATRYPSDNYYKGNNRRLMNNSRESGYGRVHPGQNCSPNSQNGIAPNPQLEVIDTRQQSQQQQQQQQQQRGYAHRHVQVKVLDDNRNVILPVPVCQAKASYLRHNNNNASRFLHDYNEPVTLSCHQDDAADDCLQGAPLCQCRYCDPATLIWDVSEQNGYSPQFLAAQPADYHHHHHHHHHRFSQMPATVFVARPLICQEHANAIEFFDVADNPCLRLRSERPDGGAILRRSWSDPTSYFSDEIVPNRDVGVIGDRGQSGESPKGRSSWRGDASTAAPDSLSNNSSSSSNGSGPGSPGLQGPLEVSTEIVTSPNGHRDLEIKFYSSSPTSYSTSPDAKSAGFVFPDDDATTNNAEEFSDIWSYHESKLQQDFRTLLQAEE